MMLCRCLGSVLPSHQAHSSASSQEAGARRLSMSMASPCMVTSLGSTWTMMTTCRSLPSLMMSNRPFSLPECHDCTLAKGVRLRG